MHWFLKCSASEFKQTDFSTLARKYVEIGYLKYTTWKVFAVNGWALRVLQAVSQINSYRVKYIHDST